MRRLVLFLLCSLVSGPARSSETNALPQSSLYTANRTYTLEFNHTNLSPAFRREAAEVNQMILLELLERECTVFLSRQFVTQEVEYFRRTQTNETASPLIGRLIGVLSASLTNGTIDWKQLRQLHTDATDVDVISRGFPWLYPWRTMPAPQLAPESGAAPFLTYTFDWQSISAHGVASVNRQAFVGHAPLWKADARVSFHGANGEVSRRYPAPPWVQEYFGQETRPIPILMEQIIADLRRALKPPPTRPAAEPPRNSKKKRS